METLDIALEVATKGKCSEIATLISADYVATLTAEKLNVLHQIILAPHATTALYLLQQTNLLYHLIPELKGVVELNSDKEFKEIWMHTLKVIDQAPTILAVRWAALFHDMGKAKAFSVKGGKVTFYHHEHISAKIFKDFATRTNIFTSKQFHKIHFLVYNLGYVESYDSSWTDNAVRRFAKDMGEHLEDILALSSSDITTKNPKRRAAILSRIEELRTRIKAIAEEDEKKRSKLPKGLGNLIISEFNPEHPKIIGEMINFLAEGILSGDIEGDVENPQFYIDYLKKKWSRTGNN